MLSVWFRKRKNKIILRWKLLIWKKSIANCIHLIKNPSFSGFPMALITTVRLETVVSARVFFFFLTNSSTFFKIISYGPAGHRFTYHNRCIVKYRLWATRAKLLDFSTARQEREFPGVVDVGEGTGEHLVSNGIGLK